MGDHISRPWGMSRRLRGFFFSLDCGIEHFRGVYCGVLGPRVLALKPRAWSHLLQPYASPSPWNLDRMFIFFSFAPLPPTQKANAHHFLLSFELATFTLIYAYLGDSVL